MSKPVKILFLASNPRDTGRLRLDQEVRDIRKALREAELRDVFNINQEGAVRVSDLQACLLCHQPDIVHFSGHSGGSEGIILEADNGESHLVATSALQELFKLLNDNIRCVVLNACYSEVQAKAITEHVDCAVGMSKNIGDEAAIVFATAFYRGLGYGHDLKSAFDLGCNEIDLENLNEQDTPKLYVREGIDPQKIVFASREPETAIKKRSDFYQHISLPPNYIPREELLAELRAVLLSSDNAPALTSAKAKPTALHGMGGIGKSVMARALCEDTQVREAFPHGILWTTLGQESNFAEKLREWIHSLGGVISENAPTLDQLKNNLTKLLEGRQCLLIVDDVWRKTHAETFRVGNQCRLLFTTRDAEVAAELGATVQPVPLMTREEAVCLLEEWADGNLREVDEGLKARIVERLGRLPLALRLAGAQLRNCEPNSWLAAFDVHRLKAKRIEGVHDSLVATFELSLKDLKETQRRLYTALAIFKEDESIPETALRKLWSGLANFNATQTAELLEDLASRALLTLENTDTLRCANLHDLLRDFISSELDAESRRHVHTCLLETYRATCSGKGWHTAPDDGYLYDHLVYHLEAAQEWDDLHSLFRDQHWMHVRVPQRDYDYDGYWADSWMQVHVPQSDFDYDGYLTDLMCAWGETQKRAQAQIAACEMPTAFADCVRYALIRTSVNSLAANYPPAFLARAIELNMWSPARALSVAANIPRNKQRAESCAAILATDKLSHDLQKQVIELGLSAARKIANESERTRALLMFVRYLSTNEQKDQILQEVLEVIKTAKSENARTAILEALAPHLKENNLKQALTLLFEIEGEYNRARAISVLAKQLSDDDLRNALVEAIAIKNDSARALALTGLAPHVPKTDLRKVLTLARKLYPKVYFLEVIEVLIPRLQGKLQKQIFQEVLAVVEKYKFPEVCAPALAAMIPFLKGRPRTTVETRAITAARAIRTDWLCAETLAKIAQKLDGSRRRQTLKDSLEVSRRIDFEPTRVRMLAALSMQLPDKIGEKVLREALTVAVNIENEKTKGDVLKALAPQLNGKNLQKAIFAASTIRLHMIRIEALLALISQLPSPLQEKALQRVLVARNHAQEQQTAESTKNEVFKRKIILLAQQVAMKSMEDLLSKADTMQQDYSRVEMLNLSTPLLTANSFKCAISLATVIDDEDDLVQTLAALMPRLRGQIREQISQLALTSATNSKTEETQVKVLMALASELTNENLQEALQFVKMIRNEEDRAYVLASFIPLLQGEIHNYAINEIIHAAGTSFIKYRFVPLLVNLADQITINSLPIFLEAATKFESSSERAVILAALLPRLTGEAYELALKIALAAAFATTNPDQRVKAFAALAQRLTGDLREQAVQEAKAAAKTIKYEEPFIEALSAMAPILPQEQVRESLLQLLASLHDVKRNELLKFLTHENLFAPPILSSEILAAIARHIIEICQKWHWL